MATKTQNQTPRKNKTKFFPIAVLRNGILLQDGRMLYTDGRDKWLYVSEDGETVYLYDNVAQLINELYRRDADDDFVITGWDLGTHRFGDSLEEMYQYYNARFD
jgi:hypothetical protein